MASVPKSKALVLGASGFLGSRLIQMAPDLFAPYPIGLINSFLDMQSALEQLSSQTKDTSNTVIVNCIGAKDAPVEVMELINAVLPARLAALVDRSGFHLVHLGSAAEIVEPLGSQPLTRYQLTKRIGSTECLAHENVAVVRIFNLHGLPHQNESGLHSLCRLIRSNKSGHNPDRIANTLRDYVHWEVAIQQIIDVAVSKSRGLQECSTGIGIEMSEIVSSLPPDVSAGLRELLMPADWYSPAVGKPQAVASNLNRRALVSRLAQEVMTCAFS